MSSELKKRMILAKHMVSVDVIRRMEARLVEIKAAHAETIETLMERHSDTVDELKECIEALRANEDRRDNALLDVKYWLQDGLVHHKLVSDPRIILRKVEEAIG